MRVHAHHRRVDADREARRGDVVVDDVRRQVVALEAGVHRAGLDAGPVDRVAHRHVLERVQAGVGGEDGVARHVEDGEVLDDGADVELGVLQREPRLVAVLVGEGDVALELEQRDVVVVVHQVGVGPVRGRQLVAGNHGDAQPLLVEPRREEDEAGVALAGGDVVGHRDVAALEPEAVAVVAEVVDVLAAARPPRPSRAT